MAISAFSITSFARVPDVERLATDICDRLFAASADSIEQRARRALMQLLEGLSLDGGLIVFGSHALEPIAAGRPLSSTRTLTEVVSRPWMQALADVSEVVLIAGPPHAARNLPPDERLHLRASGIHTLVVVPFQRDSVAAGAIMLYSQRSQVSWDETQLAPLTMVAESMRRLVPTDVTDDAVEDAPPVRTHDGQRRITPAHSERLMHLQNETRLIGESAAWRYVIFRLDQVAATHATVLLLGETGTGKEVVARAIHRHGPRASNRFVALNCAALPATLVESELFGRERGAFTGAHTSQQGRFELAHRGTLFLDEVGDLPLELQPKLLRVLQEGQLDRLGGTRTIDVDVRVVAATNCDLMEQVRQNQFRGDLYYRLNVFPITLPSLRERREDIPLLAQHFCNGFALAMGRPVKTIPPAVARTLGDYDWPGNIRELENVIQRALILSPNGELSLDDISLSPTPQMASLPKTTLQDVERSHIVHMLDTTSWRIEGRRGAAELLGLKPSTLRSRLRKLGVRRQA